MRTLDDMLQPGEKIRCYNTIWHIRAVIDEEYIVYRIWYNESWIYEIMHKHYFETAFKANYLERL